MAAGVIPPTIPATPPTTPRTLLWMSWMPTSRVRTSRHWSPSSALRASASSRRLPFSTPDDTRGIGMSRWMR